MIFGCVIGQRKSGYRSGAFVHNLITPVRLRLSIHIWLSQAYEILRIDARYASRRTVKSMSLSDRSYCAWLELRGSRRFSA